ncbi:hypothetical protein [Nocardia sp. SYP-A9097]|uniref:hypothetical protein n=1 Tax=Nocardia sp. SYP-A9097 TaxID=2663237 RepID=UPI001E45E4DE|nr:hypothetical protein [Nocardia sp. SYP-A9097]
MARAMYGMRFPGEDVSDMTMQQLRGREGARVRKIYRAHSQRSGVPWQGRDYVAGDAHATGDDLNRLLSAANAALYGICQPSSSAWAPVPDSALYTPGRRSPSSSTSPTCTRPNTRFRSPSLAAKGLTQERDARLGLRDLIAENRLLGCIVDDVKALLGPEESFDADLNLLWDEQVGMVAGGTNWDSADADLVQPDFGSQHISIVGPELDNPGER